MIVAVGWVALGRADGSGQPCDRVARPSADPAMFVRSLAGGQTGCLRGRTYRTARTIKFGRPGVTLRSQPGERATVVGRVWIERRADGVTLRGLNLDGRNADRLPSPTVNADRSAFLRNRISNNHTASCFLIGGDQYGEADRTVIEGNRIHDCGELPATNHQHGIYVAHATNTIIRDNVVYGNADRGIQLYPDADRSLITGNVIRGNGQGLIFSGDDDSASQGNLVTGNLIKNSRLRFNVEAHWQGPIGNKNYVRRNCVFGGVQGRVGGGIERPQVGFKAYDNYTRERDCGAVTRDALATP